MDRDVHQVVQAVPQEAVGVMAAAALAVAVAEVVGRRLRNAFSLQRILKKMEPKEDWNTNRH